MIVASIVLTGVLFGAWLIWAMLDSETPNRWSN